MNTRFRLVSWLLFLALFTLGCGQRQEVEEYKATWIRLSHKPVEEARVGVPALIQAKVEVSEDVPEVELFIHCQTESTSCPPIAMTMLEPGTYFGSIPSMARGTLVEYYIQARAGDALEVRVPGEDEAGGFTFYYKGAPNRTILVAHVVLMFVALFIFLICGYLALRAIRDRRTRLQIPRLGFLGGVVFFVSSFPLGMIVAYQTYGTPWTGFPVGDDLTDNKSLAIVLYFAAATFLYRGSVFKRDPNRDLVKRVSTLPYVYLVGVIMTIALFLIPH
jgi:hypothetical protein